MGYGATEGFALGCRGDGAAAGLPDWPPAFIQGSFRICSSVGLSCGLKESIRRIRDLASAVGERKEQFIVTHGIAMLLYSTTKVCDQPLPSQVYITSCDHSLVY